MSQETDRSTLTTHFSSCCFSINHLLLPLLHLFQNFLLFLLLLLLRRRLLLLLLCPHLPSYFFFLLFFLPFSSIILVLLFFFSFFSFHATHHFHKESNCYCLKAFYLLCAVKGKLFCLSLKGEQCFSFTWAVKLSETEKYCNGIRIIPSGFTILPS